jgi:hypothetical protein
MLREMSGDVITAHVRQIQIHEQDRRLKLNGESKSSCAGVRDARGAVSGRLQQGCERVGRTHVSIDY